MNAQDIMLIIDKLCEKEGQIGSIRIQEGSFKIHFKSNRAVSEEAKGRAAARLMAQNPDRKKAAKQEAAKDRTEGEGMPCAPKESQEVARTSDFQEKALSGTAEEKKEKSVKNAPGNGQVIKSPLVGTFYVAPSQDAKPFVTVGERVSKGQTIAIVEAMKLMNEIESDYDGVVQEILVENGAMVEYGQDLFVIG